MVEIALGLVTAFLTAIPAILNVLEGRKATRNERIRELHRIEKDEADASIARVDREYGMHL